MEATITTIGNVFKKQIKASFDKPTIWVDKNGNENEDTEHILLNVDTISPHALCIKQIGSHVKVAEELIARRRNLLSRDTEAMKIIDLNQLFRYAYNLEDASNCFNSIHSLTEIPEDLFWNCPNLTKVDNCFAYTGLKEIPDRLFEKSTKLQDVSTAFRHCISLTKIPENLFANCPDLSDITEVFYLAFKIKNIPENLFSNNPNLYLIERAFARTAQVDSETDPDISVCLSDKMYQDLRKTLAGQGGPAGKYGTSKADLASILFDSE